jgi:predicted AlkP superfamily phosphohydrolase/phosphomutase
VVQEVIRTADHYRGERIDLLPDLLVTWNRSAPINIVYSPKIGQVDKSGLISPRSGDHQPMGRFYGVAPDWSPRPLIGTVQVLDFAPTILRLFGIEGPTSDGTPIEALLTANPTITVERINTCPASQS